MANTIPTHIRDIQTDLKELIQLLRWQEMQERLEALLPHIRKPGWTTPAEALLFASHIHTMQNMAQEMERLSHDLTTGSAEILRAAEVEASATR